MRRYTLRRAGVLGYAGVVTTGIDALSDGNISLGEVAKIGIGVLTIYAGPIGLVYSVLDLGVQMFSEDHKSLTDRIGSAIDKY